MNKNYELDFYRDKETLPFLPFLSLNGLSLKIHSGKHLILQISSNDYLEFRKEKGVYDLSSQQDNLTKKADEDIYAVIIKGAQTWFFNPKYYICYNPKKVEDLSFHNYFTFKSKNQKG